MAYIPERYFASLKYFERRIYFDQAIYLILVKAPFEEDLPHFKVISDQH